jgi:hypothetical protein
MSTVAETNMRLSQICLIIKSELNLELTEDQKSYFRYIDPETVINKIEYLKTYSKPIENPIHFLWCACKRNYRTYQQKLSEKLDTVLEQVKAAVETVFNAAKENNITDVNVISKALDTAKDIISKEQEIIQEQIRRGREFLKNKKKSNDNNGKNKFLNFPQTEYNWNEIEQLEMKRIIERAKGFEGMTPEEFKANLLSQRN